MSSFATPLSVYPRHVRQADPSTPNVLLDIWTKPSGGFPNIYHNGTSETSRSDGGQGTFPPGSTWFYPGEDGTIDNYGAIRFTVPSNGGGDYQVLTTVHSYLDGPSSGDTDFHVLKNGSE